MPSRMLVVSRSLLCAVLGLCACSDDGASMPATDVSTPGATSGPRPQEAADHSDATPTACDPLAIETEPVTLGTVLAAGRAADGTLYVASGNAALGIERVFVSEAGALQRRAVLGSGSNGASASDGDYTGSFEDGKMQSRLVIKRRANAVVGMALVHDADRSFFDALSSQAERLTIVAASGLQGMTVKNIPGMITVEIVADAPDGSQLVLTRPTVDWSYEDFHFYYGQAGKLIERKIKNASRGSDTSLTFVVDGQDYDVIFASAVLSPNTSSTLRGGGGVQELTLQSGTPHLPEGATFECLR